MITRITTFFDRYFWGVLIPTVAIIVFLGWTFLIADRYTAIRETASLTYNTRVQILHERKSYLEKLQTMQRQAEHFDEDQLTQMYALLPHGLDVVDTLDTLDRLTREAHVQLVSAEVTPSATQKIAGKFSTQETPSIIRTATITMRVQFPTGSYNELKDFLGVLAHATPLFELQNIDFRPGTTAMAFQFQTFYLEDSQPEHL